MLREDDGKMKELLEQYIDIKLRDSGGNTKKLRLNHRNGLKRQWSGWLLPSKFHKKRDANEKIDKIISFSIMHGIFPCALPKDYGICKRDGPVGR